MIVVTVSSFIAAIIHQSLLPIERRPHRAVDDMALGKPRHEHKKSHANAWLFD
jgi:hypothetical protein